MMQIPLQSIPNQAFSIYLDNNLYDFVIKETNEIMSVSISRNNTTVISNLRIVAGTPLLPFKYLENGNFIFYSTTEDIPYYDQFGVTQFLMYLSQTEIEAL